MSLPTLAMRAPAGPPQVTPPHCARPPAALAARCLPLGCMSRRRRVHASATPAGSSDSRPCKFFRTVTDERVCERDFDLSSRTVKQLDYPEMDDKSDYYMAHIASKPSLGLAMSGGGFRAATCASGWARGLHLLHVTEEGGKVKVVAHPSSSSTGNGASSTTNGPASASASSQPTVLSHARYLSTTSGGSWFNAAFSYAPPAPPGSRQQQAPLDDFLGLYHKTEDLTLHLVEKKPELPDTHRSSKNNSNGGGNGSNGNNGSHGSGRGKVPLITDVIAAPNELDKFMGAWSKYLGTFEAGAMFLHNLLKGGLKEGTFPHQVLDWIVQGSHKLDKAVGYIPAAIGRWLGDPVYPDWLRPWSKAVSETFLRPYGLNIYEDCTLSAAGTAGNIAATRAAHAAGDKVLTACTDESRPYPIFTSSFFTAKNPDGSWLFPYEITPLYYGTPGVFPKAQPAPGWGGGYLEPWGLNAQLKKKEALAKGATGEVEVTYGDYDTNTDKEEVRKLHPVPLAQAVALSSSFLAAGTHDYEFLSDLASTEELLNWGLLPSTADPGSKVVKFGDGGMTDNLGISPLLRRGVKAIIVMVASSAPPDDTWELWAKEACDVASWFGAAQAHIVPGVPFSQLNDMNLVFAASPHEGETLFREMFEDVHNKLRAGQPGWHRKKYMVHQNAFHNIPASAEPVEVLWIFNHQYGAWEETLGLQTGATGPSDLQRRLAKNRPDIHYKGTMKREAFEGAPRRLISGEFLDQTDLERFPYFTTFSLEFGPIATNMLSQLCSAVILHPDVQRNIQELLQLAVDHGKQPISAKPAPAVAATVTA